MTKKKKDVLMTKCLKKTKNEEQEGAKRKWKKKRWEVTLS